MTNQNNWQEYLRNLLTRNGQFKLVGASQINQTTIDLYQQQSGDKETQIKIGYLNNGRLITLDITNPKTPGHNAEQPEYFYENDFDESKKFGLTKAGLPFTETNLNAIEKILRTGLNGTENKYFKGGKLQFSKVSKPIGGNQEFYSTTHYFSDKNFWVRLFRKIFRPGQEYYIEEIDLRKIFGGVK